MVILEPLMVSDGYGYCKKIITMVGYGYNHNNHVTINGYL